MPRSKTESPGGGGALLLTRYLLIWERESIGIEEWIPRKYRVKMSSICWPVVLIIRKTLRYRMDSTFVGCESKTSDKVLERSNEERMIGSAATFRSILGCTVGRFVCGSRY